MQSQPRPLSFHTADGAVDMDKLLRALHAREDVRAVVMTFEAWEAEQGGSQAAYETRDDDGTRCTLFANGAGCKKARPLTYIQTGPGVRVLVDSGGQGWICCDPPGEPGTLAQLDAAGQHCARALNDYRTEFDREQARINNRLNAFGAPGHAGYLATEADEQRLLTLKARCDWWLAQLKEVNQAIAEHPDTAKRKAEAERAKAINDQLKVQHQAALAESYKRINALKYDQ